MGEEDPGSYRGEIIVALKFAPAQTRSSSSSSAAKTNPRKAKGTILVLIKEAKNLVPAKGSSNTDPFCKW